MERLSNNRCRSWRKSRGSQVCLAAQLVARLIPAWIQRCSSAGSFPWNRWRSGLSSSSSSYRLYSSRCSGRARTLLSCCSGIVPTSAALWSSRLCSCRSFRLVWSVAWSTGPCQQRRSATTWRAGRCLASGAASRVSPCRCGYGNGSLTWMWRCTDHTLSLIVRTFLLYW